MQAMKDLAGEVGPTTTTGGQSPSVGELRAIEREGQTVTERTKSTEVREGDEARQARLRGAARDYVKRHMAPAVSGSRPRPPRPATGRCCGLAPRGRLRSRSRRRSTGWKACCGRLRWRDEG